MARVTAVLEPSSAACPTAAGKAARRHVARRRPASSTARDRQQDDSEEHDVHADPSERRGRVACTRGIGHAEPATTGRRGARHHTVRTGRRLLDVRPFAGTGSALSPDRLFESYTAIAAIAAVVDVGNNAAAPAAALTTRGRDQAGDRDTVASTRIRPPAPAAPPPISPWRCGLEPR